MAEKVELIIKIPKYYLTHPQDYSCLAECVKRGKPLPRGHGTLKDVDNIKTAFPPGEYVRTESLIATIDHEDTIIEADKTESEDK